MGNNILDLVIDNDISLLNLLYYSVLNNIDSLNQSLYVSSTIISTSLDNEIYTYTGNISIKRWKEIPIFLLFITLSMFVLISSNSFLTFYLTLEFLSLSLYIMIAKQNGCL